METVENPRKSRERSKSKSLSENETNANTENESIETAPNLNGDASEESIKDTETDTVQDDPKENENEVEKPEEPSNEAEKPEEPSSEAEKPEEPSSEAEKPEEPLNETEKLEEQLNEAKKPEEPLNEEEKPEEPSNEVEKSEEPSNEAEKPEEPSNDDVEKSPQGKKRKASEMQSGDENVNEETVESKDDATATNPTAEPDPNMLIKEEPTDVDMNVDLQMPPKQTLGKGKRARIPNKRYSDIIMSPTAKQKTAAENGDSENDSNTMDVSVKTEPLSPTSSASPLNAAKKQKFSVDLSDPKYLKPFDFGWKRELVLRGIYNADTKINGDVYYVTPNGKKVRSMREVSENLKNKKLSLDNFTFFKKALGVDDPEKEIIRDAKRPMSRAQKMAKSPAMTSPKVLSPKNSTPKTAASRNSGIKRVGLNETADSPPVKTRAAAKGFGNFKVKLPGKKDNNKSTSSTPGEKMEVEATLVKTPNTRKSGKWSSLNQEIDKPCQPCSIRCEGVHGIIPTLQCRLCLCLYHHECVGLARNISMPYVCKNCQLESQVENTTQSTILSAPPPLTPINTLKSSGVHSTTLPKLQRIPRPSDPPILEPEIPLPEMPTLTPRPVESQQAVSPVLTPTTTTECTSTGTSTTNKSIVGSVTSWLPHNSKIVDNIRHTNDEPTKLSRPQYVEFLGGRKFLVIPKHNFMSVSPAVAATAITRPSSGTTAVVASTALPSDSARLGSEHPDSSDIKIEPESPSKPENSQLPEAMEIACRLSSEIVADVPEMSDRDAAKTTEANVPSPTPVTAKKRTIKLSSITNSDEREEHRFMENYLQNLSYGYSTLLYVFQYLKVQDLLRAGCVCTMWRDIANHPMLWRTVRMKNSQVHRFEGLANTLKKHSTRHLDLRKMLLPTGGDEIWPEFSKAIEKVDTLRRIELCRCPATVVEKLAVSNPHLEVINAVTIKCETMDLKPLKSLTSVRELRLKSTGGLTLTSDIDSLKDLTTLKHLSLTSIRDLDSLNLSVIAELTNLESLDLGECTDFPKSFGSDILVKLEKLEKLRLEKGQGDCHTFEILDAVKDMKRLEQLELVNFDIKSGFDKALGACSNIKKLLIIPTYISQSATTNHMVLGGVLRLQKTLSHFVWGVTLELLRVTELFVDQCEEPRDKKEKKQAGNGDSIPVLKPVPLLMDAESEIAPALEPPQVEILALPTLQKLLMQNLPTTRMKILKIPFHATWRQSITDSVN